MSFIDYLTQEYISPENDWYYVSLYSEQREQLMARAALLETLIKQFLQPGDVQLKRQKFEWWQTQLSNGEKKRSSEESSHPLIQYLHQQNESLDTFQPWLVQALTDSVSPQRPITAPFIAAFGDVYSYVVGVECKTSVANAYLIKVLSYYTSSQHFPSALQTFIQNPKTELAQDSTSANQSSCRSLNIHRRLLLRWLIYNQNRLTSNQRIELSALRKWWYATFTR